MIYKLLDYIVILGSLIKRGKNHWFHISCMNKTCEIIIEIIILFAQQVMNGGDLLFEINYVLMLSWHVIKFKFDYYTHFESQIIKVWTCKTFKLFIYLIKPNQFSWHN